MTRFPDFQHRHTGDGAARIILRSRIDDIVGAYNDHDIGLGEIVIDLLHFKHDVVRHLGFRQQHVHVPGQSPGNGMDGKAHRLALRTQSFGEL